MLQDLDRPLIEREYEPWGTTIKLRVLSASQYVEVMNAVDGAPEDDRAAKITTMAKVCELGIVDPKASADEWANDVTLTTLMELGNMVLATSSNELVESAKKN
jgi:hypothetical protein